MPKGMLIYDVVPRNFMRIIDESAKTDKPYSLEDLIMIHYEALNKNSIAVMMFMDPPRFFSGLNERLEEVSNVAVQKADGSSG